MCPSIVRVSTRPSLRDSEQDLAIALRSTGDAVLATDTRLNPVAERLSGWPSHVDRVLNKPRRLLHLRTALAGLTADSPPA